MASSSTEAAQRPQQPEYQDCILCRLTGTAVFGMLSLGAFKEAWRLHREGGQGGSAPAATTASSPLPGKAANSTATGARATIARLVKAMEVFPAAEARAEAPSAAPSHRVPPKAAPTPASASATAASSSLRKSQGRPTARVAFLVLAGIGFGGGAVWRAVMPASKPVSSPQTQGQEQAPARTR